MIMLDTNVVSEPLRLAPDTRVEWIDTQILETLRLTAMTVAELRAGVALLPVDKRRAALHHALQTRVLPAFVERVPPFDLACTKAYAELLARVRAAGQGIETAGACIAAATMTNGFAVATRATCPFRAAGVTVINPREAAWGRVFAGRPWPACSLDRRDSSAM